MNLKELGVILRNPKNLFLKIGVWGGGNCWKSGGKFPKNGVVRGTTIRDGRVILFNGFYEGSFFRTGRTFETPQILKLRALYNSPHCTTERTLKLSTHENSAHLATQRTVQLRAD